ncbi:glycoside hydrolase family 2 TIM barrel-domain containing protein [Butyrivibrio sp. INlla16]|uniref:glycoside hydrolase family 2 TIM barrel-domain containing protein n=1 Tax=Butyrivibrio sp. INlla16 TaxID=1520807 RepID=UPI00088D88E2|nr:glycoside hydrolase family 2 TIM barrel-domain containing protein [Butyrivibrio sp. INlla16]SDB41038.1 beta-galactosidase [Butyrivibrio sp. INlla16]
MKSICIDDSWIFRRSFIDSLGMLEEDPGEIVNLPHDGMIGTPVSPDAPAKSDSGYFKGGLTNYTKNIFIPKEWEKGCAGLSFDGAMMNVTVDVNGCKVGSRHYGYAPFYVDLTDYVTFGEENRITINCNTSMHVNSRWYTGSGLYRGVMICCGPRVHVVQNGVFVFTKEVAEGNAFLEANVEVQNFTTENRLVEVNVSICEEDTGAVKTTTKRIIQINPGKTENARMAMILNNPKLWDADNPNLYRVKTSVKSLGVYRTHFIPKETDEIDEAETLFGVRTITADAIRGLRINGKSVKLKGGCLHHDNGLLGAVSLYETEARKIKKLKELGFNAVRTAHNPPSAALIEACDRLGMYVFDEAFDAWGMAKRGGDYSQFFDTDWKRDLTDFVRRDRNHPAVILWSTGNEIPERGGLDNGYTLATQLAETIRRLDGSRPVSNGICSFWSGLDDKLMKNQSQEQNSANGLNDGSWETMTEPFTNGLDVVGYNYMEDIYERDHKMFPERVILGSENFPKEIGFRWPLVEKLPYVIGEFTWTAWDYIGEAGIGKADYIEADDERVKTGGWYLMPPSGSPYPWRLANDADFDITGHMLPQGAYRSIVWGSGKTHLFSMHPDTYGKTEMMTLWGFPALASCWNYAGYEDKPVRLAVFSNADEVEVFVNGKTLGRKPVSVERPMPNCAFFDTTYEPGKVEAISFLDGKEVSRDVLTTTGEPDHIRLIPEKKEMKADGHDLIYVGIEIVDGEGNIIPDAEIAIEAKLTDDAETERNEERHNIAVLSGFGSANPVTEDNYTDGRTVTFRGRAMAIIRAGYEKGQVTLEISANELPSIEEHFDIA